MSELNSQAQLPEGTILITDRQLAGRGHRGNTWESSPSLNLTFSTLLKPVFLAVKDQFQLNMAISLAVSDAVQKSISNVIRLKWPNDIYIEDRKVGGMLIENQLQGGMISSSIVGIGLNVNQEDFTHPKASSLYIVSGVLTELNSLFQQLVESIEHRYLDLRAGNVMRLKEQYLATMYKFNEPHRFEASGVSFLGRIENVDEDGRLCVAAEGETRMFAFKEVKFLD